MRDGGQPLHVLNALQFAIASSMMYTAAAAVMTMPADIAPGASSKSKPMAAPPFKAIKTSSNKDLAVSKLLMAFLMLFSKLVHESLITKSLEYCAPDSSARTSTAAWSATSKRKNGSEHTMVSFFHWKYRTCKVVRPRRDDSLAGSTLNPSPPRATRINLVLDG